MSGCPRPPGVNNRGGATLDTTEYVAPTPIPTPEIETKNGKLSEDETAYILRSTLLPEHHEDPNVLRFIAGYMRCRNATQAAREAGLHARAGANLRSRPDIHRCLTALSEKSMMKYGFDASEIIERVKEISGIDPIEFENDDGSYKTHMKDIAPEVRRAIKRFKVKNLYQTDPNGMQYKVGEIIEVELYDKMKGLELLGREKQIFKETKVTTHDITENMAAALLESSKRGADRREAIDVTPQIEGSIEPGTE